MEANQPKRNAKHKRTRTTLEIEQRRKTVATGIIADQTYEEMAEVLNVSKATIASDVKAIKKLWGEHYTREYNNYVAVQLRRYGKMFKALWARARDGDTDAIRTALQVMDRQNKLMGIEPATKHEHSGPNGRPMQHEQFWTFTDAQLEAIIAAAPRAGRARADETAEVAPESDGV